MCPTGSIINFVFLFQNTQQECDAAYIEAADLKRQLLILHQKLQQSTPSKFSAPSITLHSSLAVSSLGVVTPLNVQSASSLSVKPTLSGMIQSEEYTKLEVWQTQANYCQFYDFIYILALTKITFKKFLLFL